MRGRTRWARPRSEEVRQADVTTPIHARGILIIYKTLRSATDATCIVEASNVDSYTSTSFQKGDSVWLEAKYLYLDSMPCDLR